MNDIDKISRAVGAGDLTIAEHVADGDQLLLEQFDAVA